MLRKLGYQVLEAKDGPEALDILASEPAVDLLFTDVVMPGGMNGRQLAVEAQKRHPGLKTLFASGYSETAVIQDGKLAEGVVMLSKPYEMEELAHYVRSVLDQSRDELRPVSDQSE